ncbi:pentapeptide repeat-containing protein [Rhodococcus sp. NPDC059234]|uniref:pentapeptide repeat-containing protein n=1 Tax=Rhodococcus sp. NPDC059234 TaxID=3346781 RepID=UPI003671D429
MPLYVWIWMGTAVTTGVGLAVLLLFARLQAGKAVWVDGFYLNGTQWFDAARTTVTLIGIIGLGGAAFLAYRKQRSTEATHVLQETGELRSRYTTCAEQLGHDAPAIRQAGVYALSSLADDWHAAGNDAERQVCIDLLCAYLRTPRRPSWTSETPAPGPASGRTLAGRKVRRLTPNPPQPPRPDPQELEVRAAVISVIRSRSGQATSPEKSWQGVSFSLSSADLHRADLSGANLANANLTRTDLTLANLTYANLTNADLRGAHLIGARLFGANLSGTNLAYTNLHAAHLTPGGGLFEVDLSRAIPYTVDLTFADPTCANLAGANLVEADLTGVNLTGANLTGANLAGANLTFADLAGANLTNADLASANLTNADLASANLTNANLAGAFHTTETRWPDGFSAPEPNPVP